MLIYKVGKNKIQCQSYLLARSFGQAKSYHCRSLSPLLSPLEVEELDAIDKDKEEKEDKANMGHNNSSKEVIFKAKTGL